MAVSPVLASSIRLLNMTFGDDSGCGVSFAHIWGSSHCRCCRLDMPARIFGSFHYRLTDRRNHAESLWINCKASAMDAPALFVPFPPSFYVRCSIVFKEPVAGFVRGTLIMNPYRNHRLVDEGNTIHFVTSSQQWRSSSFVPVFEDTGNPPSRTQVAPIS